MANKNYTEHTSYEVRRRWDKANYKVFTARLRLKEDADLIEYIEERQKNGDKTSHIIREALEKLKNEG